MAAAPESRWPELIIHTILALILGTGIVGYVFKTYGAVRRKKEMCSVCGANPVYRHYRCQSCYEGGVTELKD